MLFRVIVHLVAAATLLMVSGCKRNYTNNSRDIVVVRNEFVAFDCDIVCRSVYLDVDIQNKSEHLYCVSREFTENTAASHVSIRNISTNTNYRNIFTTGIIAPQFRKNEKDLMYDYLDEQNTIIQPMSRGHISAYLGNYFEIPRGPSEATFTFIASPCSKSDLTRLGYIKSSTKGPLVIKQ